MAASDYYLCDICGRKAFYDSVLNYDYAYGTNADGSPKLENVGDMKVICTECSETNEVVVREKQA